MGIMLRETNDGVNQDAFIRACLAKDESLIRGCVLKADAKRIPKLFEVLEEDERKDPHLRNWFRQYLSECVRMQYVSNYQMLCHTKALNCEEKAKTQFN